jgi:hypothetical protein
MVLRIQMGYSIMRRRFILPDGGLGYGIGVKSPFTSSGGFPVRCFSSNWLGVRPSARAFFSNRSKSSRENLSIADRDRENFRNSELAGLFCVVPKPENRRRGNRPKKITFGNSGFIAAIGTAITATGQKQARLQQFRANGLQAATDAAWKRYCI